MKRLVIKAILQMCMKSIFLVTGIGVIIGVLGYIRKWNSSVTYSNAFFVAGSLVIIAGGLSRFPAGQELNVFQQLYAESFRDMNSMQKVNFIVDASSPISQVILGFLTGLLLLLISAVVAKLFS
jgi:hypothetical protein